jgi:hypothetical protein
VGKTLENCIKNGVPLLLEDMPENIDTSLSPVLGKQIIE